MTSRLVPPGSRPSKSLVALAAGMCVVGAGVAYFMSAGGTGPADTGASPPPDAATCENVRIPSCREVVAADGQVVRYVRLGGAVQGAPQEAAVLDNGGPGIAVLGSHWPAGFDESVRPALPNTPVLLIEEPWVTAAVPPGCADALSKWFVDAHALKLPGPSLAVCDLGVGRWGWTSQKYQEAVAAVEADAGLRVNGMIGVSFGAFRTQYIGDKLEWAVLANPAPARLDAETYLTARREAVQALLLRTCSCTPEELPARLQAVVQSVESERAGRSVQVTKADVGAAALALAYLPSGSSEFGNFWAADAATVGRLADTVWSRYGSTQIAPSYLAYLDEVCAAYGPWSTPTLTGDVVADVLSIMHGPCAGIPRATVGELPDETRACVSSVTLDPVAPPAFRETWRADASFSTEGGDHANVHAASACIEAVLAGP